jgi:2-dehydropantoate 2-reductase
MRILILGTGATGGYYGARLLAAGRDVTFLVRPRSAQQFAERGLRVVSPHGDLFIQSPAIILTQDIREPYDLILLSCKAYDLDAAMDSIAPAVGPDTLILPMLNGMAHMAALDARFGAEHVLGGACFISATRDADGTIRHLNDLAEIVYGDRFTPTSPQLEAVQAALDHANFNALLRPNILQRMWDKWGFLATAAGITCLMRATIGDIAAADPTVALRLYAECTSVASAEGYPPSAKVVERESARLSQPGSLFTASMLRDLEDGSPVESQQILGDLLEYARKHLLTTPILEIAFTHVRCYEERRRRSWLPDGRRLQKDS